jgi:hypothetical protein
MQRVELLKVCHLYEGWGAHSWLAFCQQSPALPLLHEGSCLLQASVAIASRTQCFWYCQ